MTGEETVGKRCIHCGILSEHGAIAEDHGDYVTQYSYGRIRDKKTGERYYFGGSKPCIHKYGHQFT